MRSGTIAFLLGILLLHSLSQLPSPFWGLAAIPLLLLAWRRRHWLPAAFVLGFLWAWLAAATTLSQGLPTALEGVNLRLEGRIVGMPHVDSRRTVFIFHSERLWRGQRRLAAPGKVRLSWYGHPPLLQPGERWRLTVRLKRPHGLLNPGGFDYERWLFVHHLRAVGYVRSHGTNQRLSPPGGASTVDRLREGVAMRLRRILGRDPLAPLAVALTVGDRSGIGAAQWQLMRRTGTTHLMAISGLHIGLVAGLLFFLIRTLWRQSARAALLLPAPRAAALAALAGALAYAALAGFAVPTLRAVVMVVVVMASLWWRRTSTPANTLALALLAVLILDPLAPLSVGFWLSFSAVALILYGMGRRVAPGRRWRRALRVQGLVMLGLLPLMLYLFQQSSLLALPANLVAVPLVGLGVVPLLLCAVLLLPLWPAAATVLLQLALIALHLLWWGLQGLAQTLPTAQLSGAPPLWTLLPAMLGILWWLAPRGWPARHLGLIGVLPLLLVRPAPPAPGAARLTLLDVGQGLSAVVRTAHHCLIFDTGPRYGPRLDAGRRVLLPYLRQRGIGQVDTLVVSHADMDHSGGAPALLQGIAVARVISGEPGQLPFPAQPCRRGERWQWDGVRFAILSGGGTDGRENDVSCVLRVTTAAAGSMLLPGDIEAPAERRLVARMPAGLAAQVLIAPHHGSTTSSTEPFIKAVHPRYVLFAVGYHNRFGFPRPAVVGRYRRAGAQMLRSDTSGAVTVDFGADGGLAVQRYRQQARHYWNTR